MRIFENFIYKYSKWNQISHLETKCPEENLSVSDDRNRLVTASFSRQRPNLRQRSNVVGNPEIILRDFTTRNGRVSSPQSRNINERCSAERFHLFDVTRKHETHGAGFISVGALEIRLKAGPSNAHGSSQLVRTRLVWVNTRTRDILIASPITLVGRETTSSVLVPVNYLPGRDANAWETIVRREDFVARQLINIVHSPTSRTKMKYDPRLTWQNLRSSHFILSGHNTTVSFCRCSKKSERFNLFQYFVCETRATKRESCWGRISNEL